MIQATSLELSKQLKESGFPQESYFWWSEWTASHKEPWELKHFDQEWIEEYKDKYENVGKGGLIPKTLIAAPTAEEILELLPRFVKKGKYWLEVETMADAKGWSCQYKNPNECWMFFEAGSFVQVIAEMWLHLKRHNLLEDYKK